MRRLVVLGALVLAALLAGCVSTEQHRSVDSYLHLINGTSHLVRVYYVRGGQWRRLTRENLAIGTERTVRLPTGAVDGNGQVLLGVEYMDGLLYSHDRRGTAMDSFPIGRCEEITVRITFPAAGTGPVGPARDLCAPGPSY